MVERASRLKITVLKRFKPGEVFESPPIRGAPTGPCELFHEGQSFYVEEDGRMPEGFCGWAWNDLYKIIQTFRFHGNFTGSRSPASR